MKVRELFEDPGKDKKFITMMNQILGDIPELKQKQDDFEKKIRDIAAEVPGMFQKQRDLEKWMADAVEAVKKIPNVMLKPYMHELEGLENEYREGVSVLDMLQFTLPHSFEHEHWKRDKDNKRLTRQQIIDHSGNLERMTHNPTEHEKFVPIVVKFIQKHADDIEDAIRAVDHGFDAIRDMANKEKWPAPWQRYGKLPSDRYAFKNSMEELLYWIKELRK